MPVHGSLAEARFWVNEETEEYGAPHPVTSALADFVSPARITLFFVSYVWCSVDALGVFRIIRPAMSAGAL